MIKRMIAVLIIAMLILCGCSEANGDESVYNKALKLLEDGKTEDAYSAFLSVKDYRDSAEYIEKFVYVITEVRTEDYGFGDLPAVQNVKYTYDSDGNLLRHEGSYESDVGPDFFEESVFENGRKVKTEAQSEAGYSTITYEYDESGRLIRRVGVTEGPDLGGITLYSYDEKGNCVRVENTSYLGTDALKFDADSAYHMDSTDFRYDADGNCIGSVCDYGETSYNYTATYGDDGNIRSLVCVSDGNTTATNFIFENGNCVSVETDYGTEKFEYDENGRLISSESTQHGDVSAKSTYTTALIYCKNGAPRYPEHIRHYYSGINAFE